MLNLWRRASVLRALVYIPVGTWRAGQLGMIVDGVGLLCSFGNEVRDSSEHEGTHGAMSIILLVG